MKTRILTLLAAVTLLTVTPGCGILRQFWFGRGAKCGSGVAAQGPLGKLKNRIHPNCVATPSPTCPQPVATVPAPAADCGCLPGQAAVAAPYAGNACGTESYGGVINDPYLGGAVIDGGYTLGSGNWVPAPVDSQGYRTNKVDTDGARILSEEPLPPGAVPLN